jgi:hypothetical protein
VSPGIGVQLRVSAGWGVASTSRAASTRGGPFGASADASVEGPTSRGASGAGAAEHPANPRTHTHAIERALSMIAPLSLRAARAARATTPDPRALRSADGEAEGAQESGTIHSPSFLPSTDQTLTKWGARRTR